MDQQETGFVTTGRIAFLLAALLAAFTIGYAMNRGNGEENPVESSPQTITQLEEVAEADPEDAAGWQELGLAYFGEGRFSDAARAYEKAAQADAEQAVLWSALGEAKVMASKHDPMPSDALTAFRKALALDKADPRARYFLAVKRDLDGDHEGAISDWLDLLSQTPKDAPWRDDLVRTIEQVGKINDTDVATRIAKAAAKSPAPSLPVATRAIPGPSAQDLAAASQLTPGKQQDMAKGMVSRLESRLESDPGNIEGWIMLMRSRMTLGEPAKAKQALVNALAANPDKAEFINQQAKILEVK